MNLPSLIFKPVPKDNWLLLLILARNLTSLFSAYCVPTARDESLFSDDHDTCKPKSNWSDSFWKTEPPNTLLSLL